MTAGIIKPTLGDMLRFAMLRGPLGSRRQMGGPLGAGVQRAAAAADWWDPNGDSLSCVGAYQAIGAASYAASFDDLSGNENDLTESAAPSWASGTGWSFDGTNDMLLTPFAVDDDEWTIIVRYANTTDNLAVMVGTNANSAECIFFEPYRSGIDGRRYRYGGASVYSSNSARSTSGVMAIAGRNCYHNGTSDGTLADDYSGGGTYVLGIGAGNNWGVGPNNPYAGDILAVVVYDEVLSADDVSDVSDAMADLS